MKTTRFNISWFILLVLMFCQQVAWPAEPFPITPKAFKSNRFELEVEGASVFVHKFKDIHYAHFPHSDIGSTRIKIEVRRPFNAIRASPAAANVPLETDLESQTVELSMKQAGKLVLTLDEKERLFLFSEDPSIDTLSAIKKENEIDVLDLGADPSGQTLFTKAIQQAIDSAPQGATVRIPPGHYLSGSLFLKSGLTFLLQTGALLQASPNPFDFEPEQNAFLVEAHSKSELRPMRRR